MDLTAYQATTLAANRTEMSQFGRERGCSFSI
jgi:hypothetical protein